DPRWAVPLADGSPPDDARPAYAPNASSLAVVRLSKFASTLATFARSPAEYYKIREKKRSPLPPRQWCKVRPPPAPPPRRPWRCGDPPPNRAWPRETSALRGCGT